MKKVLKSIANNILARFGLRICRARRHEVSGTELFSDLSVLIPGQSPVCLDVGANEGQTIDALQRSLRDPHIYAFEPSSRTYELLKGRNFGNKIVLHNFALGSERDQAESINYESSVLSSFLPVDISEGNRFRDAAEESRELVQIQTVDDFISDHHFRVVDLLKTDTQGFDLEVLRGARRSFVDGLISYVLVELNFVSLYAGQAGPSEINAFLEENGLYLIDYYEKVRRANTIAWCTALFGKR